MVKVALITGSSTGIGLETAKLLASKGYRLAIHGLLEKDVDDAAEFCAKLSPQNHQPLKLVADFSDPENGASVVRQTIEHYGRLDALVNCAGILLMTQVDDSNIMNSYHKMMNININAAVKATLAAINALRQSKGCLVFISSVAGLRPTYNLYGYCMSKAALAMFARSMAVELSPDVRVNTICPGICRTAIYDAIGLTKQTLPDSFKTCSLYNRLGEPDEIAAGICFLLSDDAKFMQGHELVVDGGFMVKQHSL